ncbi:hypothetical protein EHT25_08815 [Larkinella rosea]|uniref:Uncharacterized protein n=1 Tax=Larkinella rosea TaxID=2025312 RepID=A0A3P1C390_9BACT|nr:hypothetical protein EHT25_08815 [Larkinella rosea]
MDDGEKIDLDALLEEMKRGQEHTLAFLRERGHELDLIEWLRVPEYAEKYGITPQVVEDWISAGVIPTNCVDAIPIKHGIRIIIDRPYQ